MKEDLKRRGAPGAFFSFLDARLDRLLTRLEALVPDFIAVPPSNAGTPGKDAIETDERDFATAGERTSPPLAIIAWSNGSCDSVFSSPSSCFLLVTAELTPARPSLSAHIRCVSAPVGLVPFTLF